MTLSDEDRQERLQGILEAEIEDFVAQCKTLQLATVDEQGNPNVSYSPFVRNQFGYFILISLLARHAQNISSNSQVSMMMIEDEATAKQIYARKRLTFDATGVRVQRETKLWQQVVKQMMERFGDIVADLTQLNDFNLIQFQPDQGLFVKGFGQAYQLTGEELVSTQPVRGRGNSSH
ncbi:heme utilization protein HutZ [Vibrio marisflavi]|uniref:Heme oxygenase HutZ n=1 Tax=Vibrio marisflavi CECT 7928 TaxID=634439 RepID=A0ABM8ZZP8_9VIBR|nr:heme utilization protein HutZ [Vibrio marisflavi]CAH0536427.1 Heme oxygenase HutZ [Vibrio marisflavi CECT 7928]